MTDSKNEWYRIKGMGDLLIILLGQIYKAQSS